MIRKDIQKNMLVINCKIYCTFKRVTKSGIFAYIE
ncbi:MAG: hypothetical protein D3911_01475 [Candidatus Electrothrix sp. AW3_4]|nr:hypothetical protein [Candidatus Electrothrix gigas]